MNHLMPQPPASIHVDILTQAGKETAPEETLPSHICLSLGFY